MRKIRVIEGFLTERLLDKVSDKFSTKEKLENFLRITSLCPRSSYKKVAANLLSPLVPTRMFVILHASV